ncbi:MAG: ABC transporter permease [Pseudomonadota bacterium]
MVNTSIKQWWVMSRIFVGAIPLRWAPSLVIVAGFASVVAVMVALFAIANGFDRALQASGQADRALVLRAGSTSEVNGNVPLAQFEILRDLPGIERSAGVSLVSRETYVTLNMPLRDMPEVGSLPMRGVTAAAFQVRPEVKVIEGRRLHAGKYELLAGVSAAARFAGLQVGADILIRGVTWRVVGLFEAGTSAAGGEVWVDERLLAQAWQRGETFSSALVQLASAEDLVALQSAVQADKRLTLGVQSEADYYTRQAAGTRGMIEGMAVLIGVIMSVGAVFAALNTMYTGLSARVAEIATCMAVGYRRIPIVGAVLVEAMVLGGCGASLGLALVFVLFDALVLSSVAATSTSFAQVPFQITLSAEILLLGTSVAVLLGGVAGFFPALRAVRVPVVEGLRSSG